MQSKASAYCESMAELFQNVAELRDQAVPPDVVYKALRSNFPNMTHEIAVSILGLVYVTLKDNTPEQIAPMTYGACMKHITGVQRQS